jgi:hypothetical protein
LSDRLCQLGDLSRYRGGNGDSPPSFHAEHACSIAVGHDTDRLLSVVVVVVVLVVLVVVVPVSAGAR